jgi:ribosomal protein S21
MTIKIDKKDRENFGRLMRRFNNAVQRSQVLTTAKKNKEHQKSPTKREQKEEALRQLEIERKRNEY